ALVALEVNWVPPAVPSSEAGPAPHVPGNVPLPGAPTGTQALVPMGAPLDPYDIAALADYGPAPTDAIGSALYVVGVVQRRAALKAEIARLRKSLGEAEAAWTQRLVELTRGLCERATPSDRLAPLLAPLAPLQEAFTQRDAAMREADTGYKAAVSE